VEVAQSTGARDSKNGSNENIVVNIEFALVPLGTKRTWKQISSVPLEVKL
jgi:hypothetical protein